MLTPEQIAGLQIAAGRITDPVNDYLLRDIARRIQDAGGLTSTAAYELYRSKLLGSDIRQIKARLAKLLGTTQQDAAQLMMDAAKHGYDLQQLPGLIPFADNAEVQQIVRAAVELAGEELHNITQTEAILMYDPYGNPKPLAEAYTACTDFAFKQVFTGASSYTTAIERACNGIVQHGVGVSYASGVHASLEAAVRRNIMGGLGLMVEKITQHNHDTLGCNGWEISAHANSAPDHEPIQGRQYSDAEYEALNNSLVRRIGTLNCGHTASPIIMGVNSPQYTPEQLEKLRQDNEKGVTVDGRHYTGYQATQMQRKLERAIRKQKRRIIMAAPEDADAAASKLEILEQKYTGFSRSAHLRTESERLFVSGFKIKK